MRLSWQKRRSEFNHDWLKNQFMPALAKCLNVLDDKIEDREFERCFVPLVLSEWGSHRDEAVALVRDFERDMSPRRFFHYPPLSECDDDTRKWLGDLVHALWLTRYPIKRWISEACDALRSADEAYNRLQDSIATCGDIRNAAALRPFRNRFSEFREECQRLANTLSQFPSEVLVI